MELCLHVEIAAAAMRQREEYALAGWLLLRAAGHGQGHCCRATFQAFLRQQGYRRTAVREVSDRLLASGLATHRVNTHGHEVLVPLALQGMLERYELAETRWKVDIPLRALKGQGLRHRLFASVEVGLGDSPQARATLRTMAGVSRPTQRRGETRTGAKIRPNYVRADVSTIDRMPCVAEGHEGHHVLQVDGSVYLQTANSFSSPTIPRRKRVVKRNTCSHWGDNRAQQPTATRRYHTTLRQARKQTESRRLPKVWADPTLASMEWSDVVVRYLCTIRQSAVLSSSTCLV